MLQFAARFIETVEFRKQVSTHTRQEVIVLEFPDAASVSTRSSPIAGPNAMLTATARFNSTTGDGDTSISAS